VVSSFEGWGNGRRKILRYRQEGNVGNSGGFFLEIFQEDCTGWSPRNWHDDGNVTVRWAGRDHNISSYGNVGFGAYSVADGIALDGHNNSVPYTNSETDWQHTAYFNKEETVYADSNTVDQSVTDRRQMYMEEQKYIHYNTSVDESKTTVTDNNKHMTLQVNPDPSNGRDMAVQNNYGIDGITTAPDHKYVINNSDKNVDELNSVYKCSSCAERKHVGTNFSDDTNKPGNQNQDSSVFRGQTKAPFDGEKDKSHNDTKHCFNDSSHVDKSNASAVRLCLSDATSLPKDLAANGGCQSCTADCTTGDICTGVRRTQTSERRGMLQVKPPARRNADLSELQAEGLWSLRQGACSVWSFAHWLLQAKQFLWMLLPQLLCPINSPSQSHSCQVLNQARGWFQSPRYPQPYPNNGRWCYR
jgi:hypothetical protein